MSEVALVSSLPAAGAFPADGERTIVYVVDDRRGEVPQYVVTALHALRAWSSHLVVVVRGGTADEHVARLRPIADDIIAHDGAMGFEAYRHALRVLDAGARSADEVVLTGSSWYGPVRALEPVMQRMATATCHVWEMTDNVDGEPDTFPEEGFPALERSWLWVAVRRPVLDSDAWRGLWAGHPSSERNAVLALAAAGAERASGFPARDYPRGDPRLFAPDLLMEDGFPFLSRTMFEQYPPLLDRHAVLGREVLRTAIAEGYPLGTIMEDLVRNVPPKALNTIAGMLEVLSDDRVAYDPARPFRIAVIAYVPDAAFVPELRVRLRSVPDGYDLYVTTGDGGRARAIENLVAEWDDAAFRRFETRVSWVRRGRDKAALFIACRDIILGDDYDLLIVVHGRVSSRKTQNMRHYSRRYALDNLLNTRGYTENLLGMFQREPTLGLVFPPMIHVGNAIMGRGWGVYRAVALELCERLGVRVPLDRVTPLAPFGGTWVGRPEAVRPLAQTKWSDNDYGKVGRRKYVELGRVQERLIPLVGAELGYHSRTVLTHEHAAISHTALEYKADQMFSTTRGYPFEQIRFLHRLGFTGHGGVVALSRMYIRNNHPRIAAATQPLYRIAYRAYAILGRARSVVRRAFDREGD